MRLNGFFVKTDCQKTLQILQNAGQAGVHSFDLNLLVGTTRSAARINDLKKQGYTIETKHERKGNSLGVRYFLVSEKPKIVKYEYQGNTAIPIWG